MDLLLLWRQGRSSTRLAILVHHIQGCDSISARLATPANMLLKAQTTRAGVSARQARSAFAPVRSVRAPLAVRAQKKDCAETQAFEVS